MLTICFYDWVRQFFLHGYGSTILYFQSIYKFRFELNVAIPFAMLNRKLLAISEPLFIFRSLPTIRFEVGWPFRGRFFQFRRGYRAWRYWHRFSDVWWCDVISVRGSSPEPVCSTQPRRSEWSGLQIPGGSGHVPIFSETILFLRPVT